MSGVGARNKAQTSTRTPDGGFARPFKASDFVTVWGAPVPFESERNQIIDLLTFKGYDVQAQGHFIQVRLDNSGADTVSLVAKEIRNYKGGK